MNKVYLVAQKGYYKLKRYFNVYLTKKDAKEKNEDEAIDDICIHKKCTGFLPSLTKITEVTFKTLK